MVKSSAFMLVSLTARLITNIGVFFLLANFWDIQTFGEFMYYFTLTTLVVLFIDYGFSLKLVKDISKYPDKIHSLVSQAFICKLFLTLVLILIQFIFIQVINNYLLFMILLVGAIFNSFGLFFCLPFRAINDFKTESIITLISNLLLAFLILTLVIVGSGSLTIALAFFIGRVVFFSVSIKSYIKKIGNLKINFGFVKYSTVSSGLISNFPYALHFAAGTIYLQIDTMIIHGYLGNEGVGIYQASVRILMGALILNEVLTNVTLPKLSKSEEGLKGLNININRVFLLIGCIISVILFVFAEQIVMLLYGPDYSLVINLLKLSALLLLIKYMGGLYGLLLTVSNKQNVRVIAVLVSIVINILLNIIFIPMMGVEGAVIAAIISSTILNIIYMAVNFYIYKSVFITKRYFYLLLVYFTALFSVHLNEFSFSINLLITSFVMFLLILMGTTVTEKRKIISYMKLKTTKVT
ncbi:oligosaccharide flippase family protein [Priestia megaterium]|nr:oligosaccharide flippase family protein [Priestia megaterium]